MIKYHKIHSIFKRDEATKFKTFLTGEWSKVEFDALQNTLWHAEEKVDGTNIRITFDNIVGYPEFQGRTNDAQIPTKLLKYLQYIFNADSMNLVFPDLKNSCIILYGEGYGAGIQKGGGNYIDPQLNCKHTQQFVLFDVLVVGEHTNIWLNRSSVEEIAASFSIPMVPLFSTMTLNEGIDMIRQEGHMLLSHMPFAKSNTKIEGFVMKPVTGLLDRLGHRIITKIKVKDFEKSL